MRRIKFRGLRVDGKGWVYGYYTATSFWHGKGLDKVSVEEHFISDITGEQYEVNSETVGQFTGLMDKNGVEVFEGDRVEISMLEMVVGYSETYAGFTLNRIETGQIFVYNINAKVIAVRGNIHTP
jgi:uncharacterized phage protein (TIGR01671 family)